MSIKWWTSQCKNRPGSTASEFCYGAASFSTNLSGLEQVNVPMITQVEKIVEIPQVEHLGLAVGGWLHLDMLDSQVSSFSFTETE